jgi:signal transduction histidine kinase/L-asparagine transporter-like permease
VGDFSLLHPRRIGWFGTVSLAMGGSNQSLFLLGALVVSQGTAAVPLLAIGLLLSWAAAFGWTELILMWPNRVGGIAATCAEAFRPYSAVLANLTGVCYWWGWVPTCGLTAILSASALHQWYLPGIPVPALAVVIVVAFTFINLCGVRWVARLAMPVAVGSALLAFASALVPVLSGSVDWQRAASFHLTTPFPSMFGSLTSVMAGLYLIGFAAPAFEAAACHVGETVDPIRNVPRAMFVSGAMASVYFIALPVIWLGVLGPTGIEGDLAQTLGPTFAPLVGGAARSAAIWFMVLNMFHGTLQPLAGASRTLAQLAEDGLLPRLLAWRNRTDTPWVATLLTATVAIALLLTGDPIWVIAAANLTYLIGIALPSVAVWLLRRNEPDLERPYRAPRGTIVLGLCAASVWGISTVLGFEQFGLPTVLAGLGLAYSGSLLYAVRCWSDRRRDGKPGFARSLHLKLTGAMVLVMTLDGVGYLIAVAHVRAGHPDPALVTVLEDIFVAVALLTITVGLVLPGMISHAASQVARGADELASGALAELTRAMQALEQGDLDAAHTQAEVNLIRVHSRDELGAMAASFNTMQREVAAATRSLTGARKGLQVARTQLEDQNTHLLKLDRTKDEFIALVSHELRTPLTSIHGYLELMKDSESGRLNDTQVHFLGVIERNSVRLMHMVSDLLLVAQAESGELALELEDVQLSTLAAGCVEAALPAAESAGIALSLSADTDASVSGDPVRLAQVLDNLISNALKFTPGGGTAEVLLTATRDTVRLEVRDTGMGMSTAEQEKLFTRFYRTREATEQAIQGTGLGLTITKAIVERHGGTITVTSAPGKGTTFTVELVALPAALELVS